MTDDRERWLARTLVEMAGSFGDGFEPTDLLTRLVEHALEVLSADAGCVALAAGDGTFGVIATSRAGTLNDVFEFATTDGPCHDVYVSGEALANAPLDGERWPAFESIASSAGFERVTALPLRHTGVTIGALALFHRAGVESEHDLVIAQALADIATIAVLHHRSLLAATVHADHLQRALESRVAVEQAKGVLAEHLGIDVRTAFELLRSCARNSNQAIAQLARQVVDRSISVEHIVAGAGARRGRHH